MNLSHNFCVCVRCASSTSTRFRSFKLAHFLMAASFSSNCVLLVLMLLRLFILDLLVCENNANYNEIKWFGRNQSRQIKAAYHVGIFNNQQNQKRPTRSVSTIPRWREWILRWDFKLKRWIEVDDTQYTIHNEWNMLENFSGLRSQFTMPNSSKSNDNYFMFYSNIRFQFHLIL